MPRPGFDEISAFVRGTKDIHVVVETPRASRNKFRLNPELQVFELGKVLPAGMVFPYDFGFVPSTLGEDGDPLDVLLLMDEPTFPGCLLEASCIGVIEAEQVVDGKKERNDRLIAVSREGHTHRRLRTLGDVDPKLLDQIETFFMTYTAQSGKHFKVLARRGPQAAVRKIQAGVAQAVRGRESRPS